jgi:HAE1 family hydrophobic/amphiphilic exporter-1
LVSKPLEDEISTLSGIRRLTSMSQEGVSVVIAEFSLETDVKYAEQQIRDRVGSAKRKLPLDIREPTIRRIDPADQPVLTVSIKADLPAAQLYDLANERVRPRLEQVNQVGLVEVLGGRKREIRVALDRTRLKQREVSATQVAMRLSSAGENIPAGKVEEGSKETVFRTLGQFRSLEDIRNTIVAFFGSERPTTIADIAGVEDTLEDERSRTFVNGEGALLINAFRQSGSNTIAVVDALKKRVNQINAELAKEPGKPQITVIRDGSVWIRANVADVYESILIGIVLAVLVVFYFLGSGRSTIITGLALPNSLIGAFILMAIAGFSVNIMTLLALSLAVGLLIDDAIVVRENIFRHIEMGKKPIRAALEGTAEVRLAVIATTLTVIAVFGPVAFLQGVVGQFFREFGFTICFAMAISLFDALTIAPMLSAYFAGTHQQAKSTGLWSSTVGASLRAFDRFQTGLENAYERIVRKTLAKPLRTLVLSFVIFIASTASVALVPKTFLPPQDAGEFSIGLDLPPGTSLDRMTEVASQVDTVVRANPEIELSQLTIGNRDGEANVANFYVKLIPAKKRKLNTSEVKQKLRDQLKDFAFANPTVKDYDAVGGGQRPFNLNLVGTDQALLERFGTQVAERLKQHPGLKDVDTNFRPGKPEFQIAPDQRRMEQLGLSTAALGQELRTQIEGVTPAKFRESGVEYDVRVRVREEQRNVREAFPNIYVPNINFNLVRLSDVARPVESVGPSKINRQDRGRYVQIQADIAPGSGMGNVMSDISRMFAKGGELELPAGLRYAYVGQAENFTELAQSMQLAVLFGTLFIFLVLASLYESFVTPLTIMLALPLALCGAFVALAITGESLNIFSMIGSIMLLGVATKNSILLVDYASQLIRDEGYSRVEAMVRAGKTRLRPILMTTMALIAGTIPIALGLNEASRQRTSMGIAIVGGLISSTLLTLVVVPAAFIYIDRFRAWSKRLLAKLTGASTSDELDTEAMEPTSHVDHGGGRGTAALDGASKTAEAAGGIVLGIALALGFLAPAPAWAAQASEGGSETRSAKEPQNSASLPGLAGVKLEKLQNFPRELFVRESSPVIFSVKLASQPCPPAQPAKIGLVEVTAEGERVRYVGPMMDDGILGDSVKNDCVYSRKIQVSEKKGKTLYFAAVDESAEGAANTTPRFEREALTTLTFVPRPSFVELVGTVWEKIRAKWGEAL